MTYFLQTFLSVEQGNKKTITNQINDSDFSNFSSVEPAKLKSRFFFFELHLEFLIQKWIILIMRIKKLFIFATSIAKQLLT